jgi:hypothetical protein
MANHEHEREIAERRKMRLRSDYMGADCPRCGLPITISNAGGYRTFCRRCAQIIEREVRSGEES